MRALRLLLKIILFPVTLVLSLCILILRFIHLASGMIMNIISGFLVLMVVAIWLFMMAGNPAFQNYGNDCMLFLILAFLLSPFGLPLAAGFLIEGLDAANGFLKRM